MKQQDISVDEIDTSSVNAVALSPMVIGKPTVHAGSENVKESSKVLFDIPSFQASASFSSNSSLAGDDYLEQQQGITFHRILERSKSVSEIEQALPSISENSTNKLGFLTKSNLSHELKITSSVCKFLNMEGKVALHVFSENQELIENELSNTEISSRNQWKNIFKVGQSTFSLMSISSSNTRSQCFGDKNKPGPSVEGLDNILNSLLNTFPYGKLTPNQIYSSKNPFSDIKSACIIKDNDGYIPFSRIISLWIEGIYLDYIAELDISEKKESTFASPHNFVDKAKKTSQVAFKAVANSVSLVRTLKSSSHGAQDTTSFLSTPIKYASKVSSSSSVKPNDDPLDNKELGENKLQKQGITRDKAKEWGNLFPRKKVVPTSVEWALYALSHILENIEQIILGTCDESDDEKSESTMSSNHILVHAQIIIDKCIDEVASIPFLIKTLLLLDDDSQKNMMSYSIVRSVLMSKFSLGKWIVSMLRSQHSEKAVSYLENLSVIPEQFLNEVGQVVESFEYQRYSSKLKELFKNVSQLEGLIPSMLMLDADMIEKAATTQIIRLVLDKMISGRFALTLIFLDFLFLFCLIISYRRSLNLFLGDDRNIDAVVTWIAFVHVCLFYFCVREAGKILALSTTSKEVIRRHLMRVWFLLDLISVPMTLYTTIDMRAAIIDDDNNAMDNTAFIIIVSLTTALLWIRVISLLKTINMQLATFVLATIQIVQDIAWFLLFICVVVIAAGQIFFTILCKSDYASHEEEETSCWQYDIYFSTYKIILGDLEDLNNALDSGYATGFFVVFTFLAIIILLNVLIAIISDSHEKCLNRSDHLFGRARIILIAELASFQYLIRDSRKIVAVENHFQSNLMNKVFKALEHFCGDRPWGAVTFFAICIVLFLIWSVMEMISSKNQGASYWAAFLSVASNAIVLLFLGKLCFDESTNVAGSDTANKKSIFSKRIDTLSSYGIEFIMARILGVNEMSSSSAENNATSSWRGRTNYLKTKLESALHQSEIRTISELEHYIHEHSLDTKRSTSEELDNMAKGISKITKESLSNETNRIKLEFDTMRQESSNMSKYLTEQIVSVQEICSTNKRQLGIQLKRIEVENKEFMRNVQNRLSLIEERIEKDIKDSEDRIRGFMEDNMVRLVTSISELIEKSSRENVDKDKPEYRKTMTRY